MIVGLHSLRSPRQLRTDASVGVRMRPYRFAGRRTHRELDDVLEDMREGKEGEEGVLLGCEDVSHERLDRAHCSDEVCLGEHDALGCAGCSRSVHNARDVLCLWTAIFMLRLALTEVAQLVL